MKGMFRCENQTIVPQLPSLPVTKHVNHSIQGNQRHSWILPRIPDSRYWIPVFVSGTWILDSNR